MIRHFGLVVNPMKHDDVVRDFLKLVNMRPPMPNLEWLARLCRAFHRIPYENFTKILCLHRISEPEKRLRMPDIVLADHIDFGAGGTCFSLTYFFQKILEGIGYDVYPVLCDRSYGPNTHCALVARLGAEKYLVDPGYLLEAPILVPPFGESSQKGSAAAVRLVRLGLTTQLILITERAGKRRIRYRMKDVPVPWEDFHEKWLDSFSWPMMRHMSASRQTGSGLLFMRDGVLRRSAVDGGAQEAIRKNFAGEIERVFGIDRGIVMDAEDCIRTLKQRR